MKQKRFNVLLCFFVLTIVAIVLFVWFRKPDLGLEFSLPQLAQPVTLAEGMFAGDMGSVALIIVSQA